MTDSITINALTSAGLTGWPLAFAIVGLAASIVVFFGVLHTDRWSWERE